MTTYDVELCARLAISARDRPTIRVGSSLLMTQQIQDDRKLLCAMADQLDAAAHVIERLRDLDGRHSQTAVDLANERAAALVEVEVLHSALTNHSGVIASLKERCEQLTTERDELRCAVDTLQGQIEAVAPIVDAVTTRRWIPGPPPGRGRYWVLWAMRSGVRVEAVELSPAVIYYDDPNARLLIKTLTGVAFAFEANRDDISHHMPLDPPEAP